MEDLPDELKLQIITYLPLRDILNLEQTNNSFRELSMSPKGEIIWQQKLNLRFPGANIFKSESMSSREMYVRLARAFQIMDTTPESFPNKDKSSNLSNLNLTFLANYLFVHPNKNYKMPGTTPISPYLQLNPTNDRGIAKYIIDLAERFSNSANKMQPKNVMEHMIFTYPDFEMIEWYRNTYHHTDINPPITDILLHVKTFPFKYKLEYLISISSDKMLGYKIGSLFGRRFQDINLDQETLDYLRELYNVSLSRFIFVSDY